MKRTISHEAQTTVARLRDLGFIPASVPPSRGGIGPFAALGLTPEARWPEVRQAFVARLRQYPAERHPEEFVHIVDAYSTLKRAFRELAEREAVAGPAGGDASADYGDAAQSQPEKRRRSTEAGHAAAAGPRLGVLGPAGQPIIALDMTGVAYLGTTPTASPLQRGGGGAINGPAFFMPGGLCSGMASAAPFSAPATHSPGFGGIDGAPAFGTLGGHSPGSGGVNGFAGAAGFGVPGGLYAGGFPPAAPGPFATLGGHHGRCGAEGADGAMCLG